MSVLAALPPSLRGAVAALLPHRFALVALAVFMIAGIAFADDGMSIDGLSHRLLGVANIEYVLGDDDLFLNALFPELKFYGAAFLTPLVLIERALNLEDIRHIFISRHLIQHFFYLAAGLFAYLLGQKVVKNKLLALFGMLLFLLNPMVYAASFISTADVPFLCAFMVALFLAYYAFKKDTLWSFALLGSSAGILMNLRIMGSVFIMGALVIQMFRLLTSNGINEKMRVILNGTAFALASGLTFYASLPYLWPLGERAHQWLTALYQFPNHVTELFRGELVFSENPPIDYALTWFSIATPPFALLLGAVGLAALLRISKQYFG